MKKIISIAAGFLLAVQCFATGSVPVNTAQGGYDNFTTNGSAFTSITNVFEPPFTYPPVVSLFLSSGPTNALPFTSTVTATQLVVTINTATNCAVQWSAYPATVLQQWGAAANVATVPTNIAFATPYAYVPVVSIEGSSTNAAAVQAVTAITTTNFTLLSNQGQTNYWIAVGEVLNPGTQNVTH